MPKRRHRPCVIRVCILQSSLSNLALHGGNHGKQIDRLIDLIALAAGILEQGFLHFPFLTVVDEDQCLD